VIRDPLRKARAERIIQEAREERLSWSHAKNLLSEIQKRDDEDHARVTSEGRAGRPDVGRARLKANQDRWAGATIFDKQADPDVEAFRKVELAKCIDEAFKAARQKAVKSAVADMEKDARRQPSAKSARTHKRIGEGFFASVWS
jgi:hypothetical protein